MNYEVQNYRELRIANGNEIKDVLAISVTFSDVENTYETVVEVPSTATDMEIETAIIDKGKSIVPTPRNFSMNGTVI